MLTLWGVGRYKSIMQFACENAVTTSFAARVSPDTRNFTFTRVVEFRPYFAHPSNGSYLTLAEAGALSPEQRVAACNSGCVASFESQRLLQSAVQLLTKDVRYE
jgi:hypothetical protein